MGWRGTSLSLAPRRERRRQRAGGDRLWLDQSAKTRKRTPRACSLSNKPIGGSKIACTDGEMSPIARRCVPGPDERCSSRGGGPQWRGPRFDGLAPRIQCGICYAALLRPSSESLAVTVWQACAVERVNQKALDRREPYIDVRL